MAALYIFQFIFAITLVSVSTTSSNDYSVPCSELSRELRYPCRCALNPHDEEDRPAILMDCDHVVFPGELPALPYAAPIVAFRQRHAGHQVFFTIFILAPLCSKRNGRLSLFPNSSTITGFSQIIFHKLYPTFTTFKIELPLLQN